MQRLNSFLPLLLLISIIIAFIFLQPTSAAHFPFNQQNEWNTFLKDTQATKRLDTQAFWKFREFYSPGSFHFKAEGIPLDNAMKEMGMDSFQKSSPSGLLKYRSKNITSAEAIIPEENIALAYKELKDLQKNAKVIAAGDNFVILQSDPKKAKIFLVATNDEMLRSNGYASNNKDLVKGKAWISISEVSLQ